jgi:glutamate synthase (NADPH/NADH) small chain
VSTVGFLGEDRVQGLRVSKVTRTAEGRLVPDGQTWDIPADLVILAMGFTGPETELLAAQTGADITGRGLVARGDDYQSSVPGVFVAGDAGRGQSLVVWAIAEGRAAAAGVDAYLRGGTELPVPVAPTARPMRP